ncbi:hypothetical protein FS749_012480 [Ceratobasidium sp. UAMH 11750]|nr:hypothetical protein FS749_012480 [Ceratobasidium sp. UAMH 11750]
MHRRQPEDIVFTQVCDIDSVLIIVDGDFPIHPNAVVQYYMLPDLNYTLTLSLHIPLIRVMVNEEHIDAAIHTIPNCRFAQVERALIRILFPQLIGQLQHQSNHCFVGDDYLRPFYDFAVRPAAEEILPDHYERTWPLVDACPELDWARGLLFLVEIRGVKNWSVHDPEPPLELDPDQSNLELDSNSPRLEALERLLKHFLLDEVEQDKCYVDVATTFSVANGNGHPLCALPLASVHTEMINHFTQHPMDKCERWTNSRGGAYQKEEIAHLGSVAGFWLDLSNSPSIHRVTDVQCYISDKSVTYHLNSSSSVHTKQTSPYQIMKNWNKVQGEHLFILVDVWTRTSATHDITVRVESQSLLRGLPFIHCIVPDVTL